MIIPMVLMQAGIFRDYWGDFTDNAWSVHIHYLTGTIWYLYLIIQPYFATHGHMPRHRTNGIIGMFLAGGVCLTALSMMNRDIVFMQRESWPNIDIMSSIYLTQLIIPALIVLAAVKYDKLRHPAAYLAIAVNLFVFLLDPLGRNKAVQSFLETIIKG